MLEAILAVGLIKKGVRVVKKIFGLIIIGFILIIGYAHVTGVSPEPLIRSYVQILKKGGGYVFTYGRKGFAIARGVLSSPEVQSGTKKLVSAGKERFSRL